MPPPLMKLILARQGDMQDGETLLVNKRGGMVHRHATRFIKAAGVAPWAGLWQTLRATAEKSWAMDHPQFAVSRWIGHGMAMSEKHYLGGDIPQELIDKVTGRTPKEAAQKAAQQHSADERKASEEAGAKALTPHYDAQERSTCDIRTGGGGNRTRVPEHFRKGLYVHSRSICVSTRATPVDRLHAGPTRLFSRRVAAE